MKRFSISLIIRKMKIKITMRYYLKMIRMAILKKVSVEDVEKRENLNTFGENAIW